MYRWFLALRWLLTRPINLLGVVGVAIGCFALIVVVSLFSGFLQVARAHVRSATADVSVLVVPPQLPWPQLRDTLLADTNVAQVAPRMVHYGLLLPPGRLPGPPPLPGRGALQGGDAPFLTVIGVDPAQEQATTRFAEWLQAPAAALRAKDLAAPLQPIGGKPAVLVAESRMLAQGLHPGDLLAFTSGKLAAEQDPRARGMSTLRADFVVAGAFKTHHTGFDGNNVFVAIDTLQRLLADGSPLVVREVAVKVKDDAQVDATAERLQRSLFDLAMRQRLDARQTPVVQSWRQREGWFLGGVEIQRSLMQAVLLIILVVAGVLMLATLWMLATEKTSDIGILTALGGTPRGVMQVFLYCGILVTTLGTVLGIAAGAFTAVHLDDLNRFLREHFDIDLFPIKVYNLDAVPWALDPVWMLQVAGMAIGYGALMAAIPAWIAARHDPLVSLRGN